MVCKKTLPSNNKKKFTLPFKPRFPKKRKGLTFYKSPFPTKKNTRKKQPRKFHARYWRCAYLKRYLRRPWPYRKDRRKRKGRRRRPWIKFTKKQNPILRLWLQHRTWGFKRYHRLSENHIRVAKHIKAFQMYYRVKERPCKRLVRNLKNRSARVGRLMKAYELRLDVTLYRLGWVDSIRAARTWIAKKHVLVNGIKVTDEAYMLMHSDKLQLQGVKHAVNKIIRKKQHHRYWRFFVRLTNYDTRPRGFNRKRFNLYKKRKRFKPWSRYLYYFLSHPNDFLVNYNTLTAIYKPNPKTVLSRRNLPIWFGPGSYFWQELFPAFLDRE